MGRIVEGSVRGRPLGGFVLRSGGLVLAVATWAAGGVDGDGPELTPPSGMPATARPAPVTPVPGPARARAAAPSPAGRRAVLALPGITTPSARPPGVITSVPSLAEAGPSTAAAPGPPTSPGEMPLDGPVEMPGLPPAARTRPGPVAGRGGIPLAPEPLPMDEPAPIDEPAARPGAPTRRPIPGSARPEPVPARRGRFFGMAPGPAVGPNAPRGAEPGRSVVEDGADDPAPDPALKRRIEKQAREAVGDRARTLEVRVVGKSVAIQARGVRLLQRRAVRKSLESLPALSGLRSSIEVND